MAEVERITRPVGLRRTALQRLALLVTGIIAAQSTVLAQVAAALFALDLTNAGKAESIGRRLRRAEDGLHHHLVGRRDIARVVVRLGGEFVPGDDLDTVLGGSVDLRAANLAARDEQVGRSTDARLDVRAGVAELRLGCSPRLASDHAGHHYVDP